MVFLIRLQQYFSYITVFAWYFITAPVLIYPNTGEPVEMLPSQPMSANAGISY